ncbi:MAG: adenine deaminase [Bacteroidota bacterium]
MKYTIEANLIDVVAKRIFAARVEVIDGKIFSIEELDKNLDNYILPGFVDAHIHVESSMLIPSEFARLAVVHGTVGTISDPHEIANVVGIEGVDYMIGNGNKVPFHFYFGAPSCVPATSFETAGATIDSKGIEELLKRDEIVYLAEMMNFPGVIFGDGEVHKKLAIAKALNKPIDGHAPGLRGEDMRKYFSAGITTDHECFKYEEALEKLQIGVKVLIREGSAAKNFEELIPLLKQFPEQIMFCSDDKHPDSLLDNHINDLVKRALKKGNDLFEVLRAASYNVIKHYNLKVGLLQQGDNADFIVIDNLNDFTIKETYISGELVAKNGKSLIEKISEKIINQFDCSLKSPKDFELKSDAKKIRVIEALDGQLITHELIEESLLVNGNLESNTQSDVLKIAVVNRYSDASTAIAFIKNIELKHGAIASCIAHDSHNIVAVGTNDLDICEAVNLIIKNKGGISLANGEQKLSLALPVAGIMTNGDAYETANLYIEIDKQAKALGTKLRAPFMTLSFMALLVIPELKLSDKGLFDGKSFKFTSVEV